MSVSIEKYIDGDEDLNEVVQYIMLKQAEFNEEKRSYTDAEIAKRWDMSERNLYHKKAKWMEQGLLARARLAIKEHLLEKINDAVLTIISDYPARLLQINEIALDKKTSPGIKLQAIRMLTEIVKEAYINEIVEQDNEASYLESIDKSKQLTKEILGED